MSFSINNKNGVYIWLCIIGMLLSYIAGMMMSIDKEINNLYNLVPIGSIILFLSLMWALSHVNGDGCSI